MVPAVDQLAFRHAVVAAALPDHLIDTDQWPGADLAEWRSYVVTQSRLGVPALYYAECVDRTGEELTAFDLALVARTWRDYRASRRLATDASRRLATDASREPAARSELAAPVRP